MDAVTLTCDSYQAVILSAWGANCVSLVHRATGTELLRVPESEADLQTSPYVWGLPLLFPPNRIRDGHFDFDGHTYEFPINEPARHHHIHGVLARTPFIETAPGCFSWRADVETPYLSFPHAFTVERAYLVDKSGLTQTIRVTNDSDRLMPCGVGVHAALNATLSDHPVLGSPVRCQWELSQPRVLPTGRADADTPLTVALREGTLPVRGEPISALLEMARQEVRLKTDAGTIVCSFEGLPFLMLWNGNGQQGFICPEPQSWLVDAPNLAYPPEKSGFRALAPGESARYVTKYAFEAS